MRQNRPDPFLVIKGASVLVGMVHMYECETWHRPLTEEHRLEVSENRVLMRIYGPKKREIPEGWREFQHGASYFIPITEDQMSAT
jgi:hypothetical protein